MEKIKKTLEKIGLNEKEIKIYLTSLSIGQSPASLLGQRNNIARSTAQYTCQSLAEKGLMSVTPKGNSFLYAPEDPEKLLSLINKEYDVVERKFHSTRQIMGDLKAMMNPAVKLPKVRYYTGVEGIIDMFEDILKEGKTVYGFIYLGDDTNIEILDYLKNSYIERRKKIGIKAFAISNNVSGWDKKLKSSKEVNRDLREISRQQYPINTCIQIYGDKVSFSSFVDGDLTGMIVENKNIAQTMLSNFQVVWDNAKSA